MTDKTKGILVCGSPYFTDRDAIRELLQDRVSNGSIVYTFRQDGACHITEIWARSRRVSCYAFPLPASVPKRQALILELVSIVDEVILFGDGDDVSYIFRLAKLAKRTIYVCGKENLT